MNDDTFYDLDSLFEGDEYNHRKVSNDQIPCMNNQNEEEKSTENDDKTMTIQEKDVEVARCEIDLQNLKGGEIMVRKRKTEDFCSGSTNEALVETKINLRRSQRINSNPSQEPIRKKKRYKREKIESSSGQKDKLNL